MQWHNPSQCRLRPSRVLCGPFAACRAGCLASVQTDQLPTQISRRPLQSQRCCMATQDVHKSNRALFKLGLTGSIGTVPSNRTNTNSDRQEKDCLAPQVWARARWLKCLSDRAFRCGMLIRQARSHKPACCLHCCCRSNNAILQCNTGCARVVFIGWWSSWARRRCIPWLCCEQWC